MQSGRKQHTELLTASACPKTIEYAFGRRFSLGKTTEHSIISEFVWDGDWCHYSPSQSIHGMNNDIHISLSACILKKLQQKYLISLICPRRKWNLVGILEIRFEEFVNVFGRASLVESGTKLHSTTYLDATLRPIWCDIDTFFLRIYCSYYYCSYLPRHGVVFCSENLSATQEAPNVSSVERITV